MNLYLISQNQNNGYDTYSNAVVAAEDETQAKLIHPGGETWAVIPPESALRDETGKTGLWLEEGIQVEDVVDVNTWNNYDWANEPTSVDVKLIGTASDDVKEGVICASFHAS